MPDDPPTDLPPGTPLPSERHERFACALAEGIPAAEAYRLAGYSEKHSKQAASRLAARDDVQARVAEIRVAANAMSLLTKEKAMEVLARIARHGERASDQIRAIQVLGRFCGWETGTEAENRLADAAGILAGLRRLTHGA